MMSILDWIGSVAAIGKLLGPFIALGLIFSGHMTIRSLRKKRNLF
jgi:hypothetical protein